MLLIHPLNTEKHHITAVAVNFCIPFASLCTHRTRESRPPKHRPTATPARVGGAIKFLEERHCFHSSCWGRHDTTTSWWCKLLYHYFQKIVRGTTLFLFFLHQIRSTTLSCSTCRLLGTVSPEPPALVLPLDITWCSLIYLSYSFYFYTN
jgi:hypothetical protein